MQQTACSIKGIGHDCNKNVHCDLFYVVAVVLMKQIKTRHQNYRLLSHDPVSKKTITWSYIF